MGVTNIIILHMQIIIGLFSVAYQNLTGRVW